MSTFWGGRLPLALTTLVITASVAGCGGASADGGDETARASDAATVAPSPTPTPTPTSTPLALTCESIVTADTVSGLSSEGYTGLKWGDGPWTIGDQPFADGLACIWSQDHSVGTDNFLWFGWSPADDASRSAAIASLTADGSFVAEETAEGTYVTIDQAQAVTVDENGYGTTYLFSDGWVIGAFTRAGLQAVQVPAEWTPAS